MAKQVKLEFLVVIVIRNVGPREFQSITLIEPIPFLQKSARMIVEPVDFPAPDLPAHLTTPVRTIHRNRICLLDPVVLPSVCDRSKNGVWLKHRSMPYNDDYSSCT